MARLRYNGLRAELAGSGLTNSATAVTFAAGLTHSNGTNVPTITGSDYIPLAILDTSGHLSEIVWLTAYTAATTSGTITRGQEGTTGVAHASGDAIVHGATTYDIGAFVPQRVVTPYTAETFLERTNVGTWTTYNAFSNPIGGGGIYNSTVAVNDSVAFTLYIASGTYDLNVYGAFDNSRGIVTYEVEDAPGAGTYTSMGTIDWYAAPASGFNTLKSLTGVTVGGTSGWRKLRCRVSGKNASSSSNSEFLQALELRRTA